jgi:hypothetical protein
MTFKSLLIAAALCTGLISAVPAHAQNPVAVEQQPVVEYVPAPTVIYMQAPVVNIGRRHGNLRNAQGFIVQAFQEVGNAQAANDGQLGGHAQRAKELLIQADAELRQAANVSNAEGR